MVSHLGGQPFQNPGLALLFSIGIFNALLDALGQVNIPGLSFEASFYHERNGDGKNTTPFLL